jgi:hypothetical protein
VEFHYDNAAWIWKFAIAHIELELLTAVLNWAGRSIRKFVYIFSQYRRGNRRRFGKRC